MKKTILCGFFLLLFLAPLVLNADILHLGPSSFLSADPDESDVFYSPSGYLYVENGSSFLTFYAPIPDLPHLGVIDQLRVYYYDNHASATIYVQLFRRKVSDNSEEKLAEWNSSGEADFQRTEDIETFTYPTIKSKGYRYYIRIYFTNSVADADVNLRGIRFRYYPPSH